MRRYKQLILNNNYYSAVRKSSVLNINIIAINIRLGRRRWTVTSFCIWVVKFILSLEISGTVLTYFNALRGDKSLQFGAFARYCYSRHTGLIAIHHSCVYLLFVTWGSLLPVVSKN